MKILFFSISILLSITVTAQNQISRRVFASAGKFTRSLSMPGYIYSLSYTVGEPIVFGGNGATYKLSNGFQQSDAVINSGGVSPGGGGAVTAIGLNNNPFQVYPNPFSTFLNIKGPSSSESVTKLQLIDANGKLI
ncbi:MAG: Secretion system C-terminal sorting domain, partial [Bacteroidota bacterium]